MSDLTLSKAIRQATIFLEQVHADVRSLLTELIGMMERKGWRSAFGHKVSWDLAGKLDGGCWVLPECWLLFLPQSSGAASESTRMLGFGCSFFQPDGTSHDYATFAASAVRFPTAVPATTVWDKWQSSPHVYEACVGRGAPVSLSPDQFRGCFPLADAVTTLIVPLCDVTELDVLRTLVVEPILSAEAALGAAK